MRIAYVLLAYHKPEQLARLVRRLSSDSAGFFIHVDRRVSIAPFKAALRATKSSPITFIKREVSRWGSMGCVRAILNGMMEVLQGSGCYDRLVFLSGQDYPLRSNAKILEFFETHRDTDFMRCSRLPCQDFWAGGMYRIDHYTFHVVGKRWMTCPPLAEPGSLKRRLANVLAGLYFPRRRVLPSYVAPYAGDTWFDLTADAAKYVLQFVRAHPDYLKFHRYTHIPEESFFQCILMTLPDEGMRHTLVNECPRFTKPLPPGIPHPKTLTVEDLAELRLTNKLFARKFDMEADAGVLDVLDADAGFVSVTGLSRARQSRH
jgi:hypothetical protein